MNLPNKERAGIEYHLGFWCGRLWARRREDIFYALFQCYNTTVLEWKVDSIMARYSQE